MRLTAASPIAVLWIGVTSLTLCSAAVSPAWAQEAIATAAHGPDGGAPIAPTTERPLSLDDDRDDGPGFLRPRGPCGGPAKTAEGKTDKAPHGEVWAGIGTHGYREAGGAVCVPVGDNAAVSIAIDAGHIDGRGGRRR